jgi:hypothetical protein
MHRNDSVRAVCLPEVKTAAETQKGADLSNVKKKPK